MANIERVCYSIGLDNLVRLGTKRCFPGVFESTREAAGSGGGGAPEGRAPRAAAE